MVENYLAGLGTNDGAKDFMLLGLAKRLVRFTLLIRRLENIKNNICG
tara:strand:+ start:31 stop:171 length:141 start_codon:yes stop_codon:yes gene_type:complete